MNSLGFTSASFLGHCTRYDRHMKRPDRSFVPIATLAVLALCLSGPAIQPGSDLPLRRRLLPQIQPARRRLGARPQDRRTTGHEYLSPLVPLGLHRKLSGQIRLARLRPHGGTRSAEPHQSRDRRNHQRRARMDVGQVSRRPATSISPAMKATPPSPRAAPPATRPCAWTTRTSAVRPKSFSPRWWSAIAAVPRHWATTCGTKAACRNASVRPRRRNSANG